MNRLRLLVVSFVLLLALTAIVFWRVHWSDEPMAPVEPRLRPQPVADTPPEPAAVRQLEIVGLVLGQDLSPLAGVEVLLGDERCQVDAQGKFAFPKSQRPRLLTLRVVRGSEELTAWSPVIAGDYLGEASTPVVEGALAEDELSRGLAPRAPARVRLTINLGAPAQGQGSSEWLVAREALVEEWGEGARISLRGDAKLPDAAHMAASLYFDQERTVAAPEPVVKGSRFEAALYWPQDMSLFSGELEARLSYSAVHESLSVLEAWSKAHPEVDWENLEVREAKHRIFVGSIDDARAEDQAASAYYSRQLDESRRLERALKSTLTRPVDQRAVFRSARRPGGKNSKDATTWLRSELLTADGKLDEPKWRQFLDDEWRPAVRKLQAEHAARGSEKYGRAARMLSALLEALLDESYGFSKFILYPAFGLTPHPNDDYVDEERSGDLIRLEKIVVTSFEGLERYRSLVR